jgi:CBS domain containing-hemolysin-like protein
LETIIATVFNLFLVLALVLLNGFFVAAEFAIVKVRSTRITMLREEGDRRARIAEKVLANLDAYLSATQLGITLASLGLGWIGEPAIARLIEPVLVPLDLPEWAIHSISFIIAFSFITFLHIVLGEMAPKSLAIRRAESTTLWTSTPLHWFYRLFYPFIFLLNGAANRILRWLGVEMVPEHQQAHNEEEIRMLVAQSHKSGIIDQTELALFDKIFEFADRVAREVMVPRVDMICLYIPAGLDQNLKTIKETQYTRYPLCGKDKDDIRGIVHVREVYEHLVAGETPDLERLARPAIPIPETLEIKDALRILQKKRAGMAIVIDEYGGTAGLVTTEDIIEEIVGEIQDEFDDERPFFQTTGEGTSIDARLLIEEVNEYFGMDIDDPDNDTIGGWVFSQLQEVPQIGDEVTYREWIFTVQEIEQRSVTRLLVKPNKKTVGEKPSTRADRR